MVRVPSASAWVRPAFKSKCVGGGLSVRGLPEPIARPILREVDGTAMSRMVASQA